MKKTIIYAFILSIIMPCISYASSIDLGAKATQLAGEIIANPTAFFYEFQQDLETTTPLPPGKTYGFQTGIFPTLLPATYANLSGKYRLHGEGRISPGLPQLDIAGGYWNMIATKIATEQSKDINSLDFNGYYIDLIMSSSVSPKIRTFYGYKYSQLKASLKLNKAVDIVGAQVTSFDAGFRDDFLIAGIEHITSINKFWSIQMNYGIKEQVLASKISWYGKYFEFGLNIYPEGILVIHPVVNFHLNF